MPQIIYLLLISIGLLLSARKHGVEKTEKENFWTRLITVAIVLSLLYWGGFFDNIAISF